jgi:hypothetical protein
MLHTEVQCCSSKFGFCKDQTSDVILIVIVVKARLYFFILLLLTSPFEEFVPTERLAFLYRQPTPEPHSSYKRSTWPKLLIVI